MILGERDGSAHSMDWRTLLIAAGVALAQVSAVPKQVSPTPDDVQARADAMLARARRLEDIRSSGAPPFRLTAKFSFTGNDLEPVHGTYSELWVSNSKWRQETVVGNLRSVAVGGAGKHWILVPDGFPIKADKLPILMAFLPPPPLPLKFDKISEVTTRDLAAECVYTKLTAQKSRSAFCFDKKSGVLLQRISPEVRLRNVVRFGCQYGRFQLFGQYVFPHEVACLEDQHKSIRADVVELTSQLPSQPPVDAALFGPPPGAVEIPECTGKIVAPFLVSRGFTTPDWDPDRVRWLPVWLLVDAKGNVQHVRLLRSADKISYQDAMNIIRGWSFMPGICNGKPMPMPYTAEVPVR
jgi:hypothetical protein